MKPLSRFFRLHHAVVASFIALFPIAFASLVGTEGIWTIVGWSISTGWTVSAMLEAMALASERWRPTAVVSRSTLYISLVLLASAFVWSGANITVTAVQWNRWYGPSLTSVVHMIVTGNYWHTVFGALTIVVHWLSLVGAVRGVRELWPRGTPGSVGRPTKVLVIMASLLLSVIVTDGINDSLSRLRLVGYDVYNSTVYIVFRTPLLLALVPFIWFVILRLTMSWLMHVTSLQSTKIILTSASLCIAPFVYGMLRYGPTAEQINVMEEWYLLVWVVGPVVTWMVAFLFRRRTAGTGE